MQVKEERHLCLTVYPPQTGDSFDSVSVLPAWHRRKKKKYFSFSGVGLNCLAFMSQPHFLLTLEIEYEREKKKAAMNMQMPFRDEDVDLDFTVLALALQKPYRIIV